MLSPQDASLGTTVDNKFLTEYPLLLRSWDDLMNLVAGVQGQRYTDQGGSTSNGRTGGFNVHGVRSLQNNFILDGIDNNSISENVQELTTQVIRPSVDTIQEFKIITNPYSAEYGRNPGAAISVVTKGGTNDVHGLAYEYLRNRLFDANDFFSNRQGLAKPENVQNQFGGNLGGPVRKNKIFAFFDFEGTTIRKGQLRSTTVPTPNERIGDFSAAAGAAEHISYPTLYDQANGTPFPNNQIPAARIEPLATRIMNLFPAQTVAGAALNNFFRNANLMDDLWRYSGRIDWQPDDKDSVFTRITFTNRNRFIPGNFGGIADGTASSSQGRQQLTAYQVPVGWTRTINPRIVNELRIGFARDNSQAEQDPFGLNHTADYVPGVPVNPAFDGGVPMITFANLNTFIGSPNFLPKHQVTAVSVHRYALVDGRAAPVQVRRRHPVSFTEPVPGHSGDARRPQLRPDFHLPENGEQPVRLGYGLFLCRLPDRRGAGGTAIEPVSGGSAAAHALGIRAGRFQGDSR
jgi:hypothetical protein